MNKNRLGKNLNTIFGNDLQEMLEEIQQGKESELAASDPMGISISMIHPNPYQPRKVFDPEALEELARSIAVHGVFTPILVRKSLEGYDLIAGERRLKASQLAGKDTIPAIVVQMNEAEMMEISLLENIQRENLSSIEEAMAYDNLIHKLHYTQEQLAAQVGKSREHISNTLRLLKLPKSVQKLVLEQQLSMGHVRALLSLKDPAMIEKMAERVRAERWSVRKTESEIRVLLKTGNDRKPATPALKDLFSQSTLSCLEDFSGQKVEIRNDCILLKLNAEKARELADYIQAHGLEEVLEDMRSKIDQNPVSG